jgi:hypothetical protein
MRFSGKFCVAFWILESEDVKPGAPRDEKLVNEERTQVYQEAPEKVLGAANGV